MTDRHAGYIVTLARDIREDDAERIISAILMIKGVMSVDPVVADVGLHMAERRARQDIRDKLWKFAGEI